MNSASLTMTSPQLLRMTPPSADTSTQGFSRTRKRNYLKVANSILPYFVGFFIGMTVAVIIINNELRDSDSLPTGPAPELYKP